ncbi:hypothetical protein PHYSODRAFT_295712 [Phytophthora sojae]|uniref:Uncharacterized protein n=1 Tax=Phytophthora sojae (strain P6497) TaxID=1094619 RepID=G4YWN1_PHYSP|nr:hypothetical protein PHYSODRAFT_295711 [Phytophthora sojae]XP_009518500.1 hypothetical protein PHYSODRAFT_295712 [Phytophthora sojae]EGZ23210.1 hypothetical protein PHYSODRAFT_295711 [Phytophthora sojae]EGZ23212.1 hypothetical protein PHYSODRAFT_295712 [Phytophthora sojae]|eukprot:XP_009518498.1 hypothetical protein PHYSODRAFT_295711 [Phytophthora sojae]
MAIDRSRKRTRLAMVVVRSPTHQGLGDALLEDQQRVQMQRQAGDSRQIVVMASPEELRAARAARPTATASTSTSPLAAAAPSPVATETQRRLLAYAHRARRFLSHRAVADSLSRSRRSEMLSEIQRLKEEMRRLQGEIEVTTRCVESMERLAFHLERLTRDFVPGGGGASDHGPKPIELQVPSCEWDLPAQAGGGYEHWCWKSHPGESRAPPSRKPNNRDPAPTPSFRRRTEESSANRGRAQLAASSRNAFVGNRDAKTRGCLGEHGRTQTNGSLEQEGKQAPAEGCPPSFHKSSPSQDSGLLVMILDRSRRRRYSHRALRVIRSPTRQGHQRLLSETPQAQPVVVLPAELPPRVEHAQGQESNNRPAPAPPPPPPTTPASTSLATTQRLLVAHAQRARHVLSNRSTVEALRRTHHQDVLEEIEQMKKTIQTLQSRIEVTAHNVETMENLIVQLQRITSGLHESSDGASTSASSSFSNP